MDWIAEKMKANLSKQARFISYSNGVFKYKSFNISNSNDELWTSYLIDLNKVKGRTLCVGFTGAHVFGIKRLFIDETEYGFYDQCQWDEAISIGSDPSLCERFIKAVDYLIKFNTQKAAGEKF